MEVVDSRMTNKSSSMS